MRVGHAMTDLRAVKRITIADASMIAIANHLRASAESGIWHGEGITAYFERCRIMHVSPRDPGRGTLLIFTREDGYHTSGWWKNPDYERCYHLSLSGWDAGSDPMVSRSFDPGEAETWVRLMFGPDARYAWRESAISDDGRAKGVEHWRVFCDPRWRAIKPRGEVYGKEFTERGWLSFSDVSERKARAWND